MSGTMNKDVLQAEAQDTTNQRVRTNCRACGHAGCGAFVDVENGIATKIKPDKEHPISNG